MSMRRKYPTIRNGLKTTNDEVMVTNSDHKESLWGKQPNINV